MEIRSILKCVEEGFRLCEILGVEPFRKPAIDPREHVARQDAIAALGQEPRESRRTT